MEYMSVLHNGIFSMCKIVEAEKDKCIELKSVK